MEEHIFTCITNEDDDKIAKLASQMYGEFYYAILIAISGIVISLILDAQGLYQWAIQHKKRKAWVNKKNRWQHDATVCFLLCLLTCFDFF